MGLHFKPNKCKSLSICGGAPKNVSFVLTEEKEGKLPVHIETVHNNPHKFLGSTVTYNNTAKEYFTQFKQILSDKLENIDKSKVRGEHKLAIYERHALPSMRYHLSIHNLHQTHLDGLDHIAKTFLKKWLNFPTRGVTHAGIFHPYLLNVKEPSQIYLEGHANNMLLMRMKGDETVNACIDSQLERESTWRNKSSTAVKSNTLIAPIVENTIPIIPSNSTTRTQIINRAKKVLKKTINEDVKDKWDTKIQSLTMQVNFTELLIEEKQCVTWQSIARKVPRNVMSFATRLATNSLPSPDNLRRWGKRKLGTCPLCASPNATLAHITNMCTVALNQGRFTWRHDSVLLQIASTVKGQATQETEVFADLPSYKVNGTTIPADILVSTGEGSKPDLVLINRKRKTIALLELTCSLLGSATKAHTFKDQRYTQLSIDLEEKGYQVFLVPFEVLSPGHISHQCKESIKNTLQQFSIRTKKALYENLAKIALLCTMSIFHAYQVKEWVSPPLLTP